jgi:hypothetical protein
MQGASPAYQRAPITKSYRGDFLEANSYQQSHETRTCAEKPTCYLTAGDLPYPLGAHLNGGPDDALSQ